MVIKTNIRTIFMRMTFYGTGLNHWGMFFGIPKEQINDLATEVIKEEWELKEMEDIGAIRE